MNEIRDYWEKRATERASSPQATTNDVYLRELEIATFISVLRGLEIPQGGAVLDVGCGDGYTTMAIAGALPHLKVYGVDYSQAMLEIACASLAARPALKDSVAFSLGDATDLVSTCGDTVYDVVLTDRCLINLESRDDQECASARSLNAPSLEAITSLSRTSTRDRQG